MAAPDRPGQRGLAPRQAAQPGHPRRVRRRAPARARRQVKSAVALRSHACRLADRIATAAVLGLLALALLTVADVTGRYLFATPIRGFNDIVPLAGAVLLSACMPHVVARRPHLPVQLLRPPP